jgi:hypothetical protein
LINQQIDKQHKEEDLPSALLNDKNETKRFLKQIEEEVGVKKVRYNSGRNIKLKFKQKTEQFFRDNSGKPDLHHKKRPSLELNDNDYLY